MRERPVFCTWDGEHFVPHKSFQRYCDQMFTIGEVYPLGVAEERNMASHRHYFAALKEGFNNLSEENAKQFPTVEHLRHWALVQCGYCDETTFALVTSKEARKLAMEMRKINIYAVMAIRDTVLRVFTAQSQSTRAMKKERFEQSKKDVLDLVASMSRTTRGQLNQEARHHGR